MKQIEVPKQVNGVPVYKSGDPMDIKGGKWYTLVPEDDHDDRLWEWDAKSGQIVQTQ